MWCISLTPSAHSRICFSFSLNVGRSCVSAARIVGVCILPAILKSIDWHAAMILSLPFPRTLSLQHNSMSESAVWCISFTPCSSFTQFFVFSQRRKVVRRIRRTNRRRWHTTNHTNKEHWHVAMILSLPTLPTPIQLWDVFHSYRQFIHTFVFRFSPNVM